MISCEKLDDEFIEDQEEKEFTVASDMMAEWCIKKIKKAQEEHDRLVALAQEEIAEYNRQIAVLDQQLESATGFLKSKLYEYFNTVEHKATKTQESYKLLSGSLVFKKPSQKMNPDKEKLLEYVKANNMPEFVKVKEDVDWLNYKKECEIINGKVVNVETGDVLPEDVISVEEVAGEFNIKF